MHSPVACTATAIAARNIDDDFARRFAGFRIKIQRSTLQFEGSVHCVQNVMKRELDFGLGWIEAE